jgi:hypothetical protein
MHEQNKPSIDTAAASLQQAMSSGSASADVMKILSEVEGQLNQLRAAQKAQEEALTHPLASAPSPCAMRKRTSKRTARTRASSSSHLRRSALNGIPSVPSCRIVCRRAGATLVKLIAQLESQSQTADQVKDLERDIDVLSDKLKGRGEERIRARCAACRDTAEAGRLHQEAGGVRQGAQRADA